ncbi:hypothetical protein KKE14_00830 [Patescibacteria group bacterium]|nr:hypothetical protein [Patescibacteria group bacterium]
MTNHSSEHLEESLRTLGKRADLSFTKKQAIRDKVFRMVGQVELADAIIAGKQKASVLVSLKSLKKALLPDKISFSMPATVAMMMVVFASSVITGALAQGARPTDMLFPVKKVLESIEIAFISNPVSRAKVKLNIADERMRHLESSADSGEALVKVLKESQIALVNAKVALEKVAPTEGSDEPASVLLEKFSALLSDQKAILSSLDKKTESENVKKAVVAIRETLDADAAKLIEDNADTLDNSVVVKPTNVTKPEAVAPLLQGRQTITGRLITSSGQPAIYSTGKIYLIKNLVSVSTLSQYIGTDFVIITGDIVGNEINTYQIVVNGKVVVDAPIPPLN